MYSSEDKPSPPPSMARLILDRPVATKLHPSSSSTIFLSPRSILPQLAVQLVRLLLIITALKQLAGAWMPNRLTWPSPTPINPRPPASRLVKNDVRCAVQLWRHSRVNTGLSFEVSSLEAGCNSKQGMEVWSSKLNVLFCLFCSFGGRENERMSRLNMFEMVGYGK